MKTKNEITVWVGRDGDGDFEAGTKKEEIVECAGMVLGTPIGNYPTSICGKHGLALGLHRIVKKGQVARVTFTAKAVKS